MVLPPLPVRPDFLILGAQKCGTTSIASALRQHADVFLPAAKEAQHWGSVPDDEAGGARYQQFFAEWDGRRIFGEATPEYLYRTVSMRQILRGVPDVKAIVSLRNPVDRAYSAYWHAVRVGTFRGTFESALAEEPRLLAYGDYGWAPLVDKGKYVIQLQRWLNAGLDRAQLHVVLYEELTKDPAREISAMHRFLGIGPGPADLPSENVAQRNTLPPALSNFLFRHRFKDQRIYELRRHFDRPFTPRPMNPITRLGLVEVFRPYNAALADLLGRPLPDWDR